MESFRLVRAALDRGPLEPYALFAQQGIVRWPYPPAFFPWIWVSGSLAGHGLSFAFFVRVPSILADAAAPWLVQEFLGSRGAGTRTRLVAAGLVALGPSFLAISGYHGQFDVLAILPGVAAVSLWERREDGGSRALAAGLLIGVGGALKTVPLLLLLALLPSVRSRREALTLLAAAGLPLVVAFAPFAVAGKLPSPHVLTYRGLPGAGGLSILAQPDLSLATLGIGGTRLSGLSDALVRHGSLLVGAGLLAVVAVGVRSRAGARRPAVARGLRLRRDLLLPVRPVGPAVLPHGGLRPRGARRPGGLAPPDAHLLPPPMAPTHRGRHLHGGHAARARGVLRGVWAPRPPSPPRSARCGEIATALRSSSSFSAMPAPETSSTVAPTDWTRCRTGRSARSSGGERLTHTASSLSSAEATSAA